MFTNLKYFDKLFIINFNCAKFLESIVKYLVSNVSK